MEAADSKQKPSQFNEQSVHESNCMHGENGKQALWNPLIDIGCIQSIKSCQKEIMEGLSDTSVVIDNPLNKVQRLPNIRDMESSVGKESSCLYNSKSSPKWWQSSLEISGILKTDLVNDLPKASKVAQESLSCSEIKFEEDDSSDKEPTAKPIVQESFEEHSKILTSQFLNFSSLHPRKTRKEKFNDLSFETQIHNIYNPEMDSSTSSIPEEVIPWALHWSSNSDYVSSIKGKRSSVTKIDAQPEKIPFANSKLRLTKLNSYREPLRMERINCKHSPLIILTNCIAQVINLAGISDNIALFSKGPVVAHHRNIALSKNNLSGGVRTINE